MEKCKVLGRIHSFESMAAVDGAGVRCAVFLSGCPLRCVYCHNPDTWSGEGVDMTAERLVRKVCRYRPYFGERGGVTFSGGEPLLQSGFVLEAAHLLKREGISYAIDTSGAVPLTKEVADVLRDSCEVLLDLKFWDDASYLAHTGHDMKNTLEILSFLNEIGKDTTIRTVVVPGINDSEEVLSRYLAHVRDLACVRCYELLPFHTMGFSKYEKLKIPNPLSATPALSTKRLAELEAFIRKKRKENG